MVTNDHIVKRTKPPNRNARWISWVNETATQKESLKVEIRTRFLTVWHGRRELPAAPLLTNVKTALSQVFHGQWAPFTASGDWIPFSLPHCLRTVSTTHLPWGQKHSSAFWNNNCYKHIPFLKHIKTTGRSKAKQRNTSVIHRLSGLSKPLRKIISFWLSQEETKILRFRT